MQGLTIRMARADEYDEVARVWIESWLSLGLERASEQAFANARARIPEEIANGWSLYVVDDAGGIAGDAGISPARLLSRPAFRCS